MIAKFLFLIFAIALLTLPLLLIKSQEGKIKSQKGKLSLKIGLIGYMFLFWILMIITVILYGYLQLEALQKIGSDEYIRKLVDKNIENPDQTIDTLSLQLNLIKSYFLSTSYVLGWFYGLIYFYVFKFIYTLFNFVFLKARK